MYPLALFPMEVYETSTDTTSSMPSARLRLDRIDYNGSQILAQISVYAMYLGGIAFTFSSGSSPRL